jgi:hypothetical protein
MTRPTDADPLQSLDARVWAAEFMKITEGTADEETMLAWFANAIMCGWDHHCWQSDEYKRLIGECTDNPLPSLSEIALLLRELAEAVSYAVVHGDMIIHYDAGEECMTDRARAMAERLDDPPVVETRETGAISGSIAAADETIGNWWGR